MNFRGRGKPYSIVENYYLLIFLIIEMDYNIIKLKISKGNVYSIAMISNEVK
jgi:hypothetical protein